MNELALFAGAGGGILGGKLLGWRTVCAVERDAYAAQVLAQRQNDGTFKPFPIWSDVSSFDGYPWRGIVDVISISFPCTNISAQGDGTGIDGDDSGQWKKVPRIIDEVRSPYLWIENSPLLVSRGLDRVLCDIASLGYDAKWGVMGAYQSGAPHRRDRIWIKGTLPNSNRISYHDFGYGASKSIRDIREEKTIQGNEERDGWWDVEPELGRVANGVAYRSHRLKAIGNGQVSRMVPLAWSILSK